MAGLELMLASTEWDLFFGSVVEAHVAGHLGFTVASIERDGVPDEIRAAYGPSTTGSAALRAACPPAPPCWS